MLDPEDGLFLITVTPFKDFQSDAERILRDGYEYAHNSGVREADAGGWGGGTGVGQAEEGGWGGGCCPRSSWPAEPGWPAVVLLSTCCWWQSWASLTCVRGMPHGTPHPPPPPLLQVRAAHIHVRTLAAKGSSATGGIGESVIEFVEANRMALVVLGSRGLGSIKG